MIRNHLIFLLMFISISSSTLAENDMKAGHRITTRFDLVYNPIGAIKTPSSDSRLTFYDSFAFKLAAEYFVSDYISIGPGIEYLSRKVNPDATFSANIKLIGYYLDGRFNYPLTDSGKSYLVIGLGTGISTLAEAGGSSSNGPSIYSIIGLDIGLRPNIGLDLLYRYGFTGIELKNIREYRFEGWALQAGLSYRFKF
jgi:hypothetical protein